MKRISLIALIAILTLKLSAQPIVNSKDSAIYVEVDQYPEFPGGLKMLDKYINERTDKILRPGHATGLVIAQILVEENGKILSAPGIIEGLTNEIDSTAIYLLTNGPFWKPGIKNGRPVRTLIRIALRFNDPKSEKVSQSTEAELFRTTEYELTIEERWGESDESKNEDPERIYTSVDQVPEFRGGTIGFDQYIKDHIVLNGKLKKPSDKVMLSFIVELDGSLSDIKVINTVTPDYDAEALRLIKQSPKWYPGIKNGMPVRARFTATINFNSNQ